MRNHTFQGKVLYKFLKRNNALNAYITELCDQRYDDDTVKKYNTNHDVFDLLDKYNIISMAFIWEKTSQGAHYWLDIQNKFLKYFAEEDNIKFNILLR